MKSFDEVRNQIADDLARDEAVRLRDAAIEEIEKAMKRYFQELAIFESQLAVDAVEPGDRPVKPDLQTLAEEYGLQYRLISETSRSEIDDDPIAGSLQPGESPAQQRPDFTSMMYGLETRQQFIPRQPLFSPIRTVAVQTSTTYVAWKIDETEAYVPELDEAREEVIEAVRTQEARELARAAAEEIAVEANAADDAPLTQFVREPKQELIRRDLGPFSWMNTFGFMQATIGNVPQLDDVGDQFMRAVFNAETGQHVVAPNRRESVFYVVKPTTFQPPIEQLRDRFLQPQERMMALLIESEDMSRLTNGFFEALDERTGFEWPEAEQP